MTSYRIAEHGEARDPNKNYRVDISDGTLYEVTFENPDAVLVAVQETFGGIGNNVEQAEDLLGR